jgi:lipopolysaccharide export LptBFGC system permease protein LptF
MKGINELITFAVLVSMAVTIAMIVSGWLIPFSREQTGTIENQTREKLACQDASLYIKNVTYNCSSDCSVNTIRNLTIEVKNSGTLKIRIDNIYIINTTGSFFYFSLNETKTINIDDTIILENISTMACSGINNSISKVRVIATNCPGTAYDNFPGSDVTFLDC